MSFVGFWVEYVTNISLDFRLGSDRAEIVRISAPIKEFWAKEKNLDLKELLSDGPYKEIYRKQMIVWSDEMRAKDYGFFCREATKNGNHFESKCYSFLIKLFWS